MFLECDLHRTEDGNIEIHYLKSINLIDLSKYRQKFLSYDAEKHKITQYQSLSGTFFILDSQH